MSANVSEIMVDSIMLDQHDWMHGVGFVSCRNGLDISYILTFRNKESSLEDFKRKRL